MLKKNFNFDSYKNQLIKIIYSYKNKFSQGLGYDLFEGKVLKTINFDVEKM